MSREDFLGMILSVVGLNENIFDMYCYGMDREGFATDDLKTGNQYQITNDISEVEFDKIYRLLVMLIYYKHIKKHTSIEERTILQ